MPQRSSTAPSSSRRWWFAISIAIMMVCLFAGTIIGLKIITTSSKGSIPALATISPALPPMTSLQSAVKKPVAEAAIPDAKPSGEACDTPNEHSDPTRIDVLVNKKHCLSPRNYAPKDLITTDGAVLRAEAARAFSQMTIAAATAGNPLTVTSSYRSYQNQVSTYNVWVAQNGSASAADKVSARPGYSEHQTGLAVDVAAGTCALECFSGSSQAAWLSAHAAEYGFINRYPAGLEAVTGYDHESWHYRYVGISTAQDMKRRGIKTLEQYWNISGGDY